MGTKDGIAFLSRTLSFQQIACIISSEPVWIHRKPGSFQGEDLNSVCDRPEHMLQEHSGVDPVLGHSPSAAITLLRHPRVCAEATPSPSQPGMPWNTSAVGAVGDVGYGTPLLGNFGSRLKLS